MTVIVSRAEAGIGSRLAGFHGLSLTEPETTRTKLLYTHHDNKYMNALFETLVFATMCTNPFVNTQNTTLTSIIRVRKYLTQISQEIVHSAVQKLNNPTYKNHQAIKVYES